MAHGVFVEVGYEADLCGIYVLLQKEIVQAQLLDDVNDVHLFLQLFDSLIVDFRLTTWFAAVKTAAKATEYSLPQAIFAR